MKWCPPKKLRDMSIFSGSWPWNCPSIVSRTPGTFASKVISSCVPVKIVAQPHSSAQSASPTPAQSQASTAMGLLQARAGSPPKVPLVHDRVDPVAGEDSGQGEKPAQLPFPDLDQRDRRTRSAHRPPEPEDDAPRQRARMDRARAAQRRRGPGHPQDHEPCDRQHRDARAESEKQAQVAEREHRVNFVPRREADPAEGEAEKEAHRRDADRAPRGRCGERAHGNLPSAKATATPVPKKAAVARRLPCCKRLTPHSP